MRADAKVLLERLGRSDFRYREFVDRFAELESWPIFEALLKDPRIMPQSEAAAIEAAEPGDSERQPAPRAQARPVEPEQPRPAMPPHATPPHAAALHHAPTPAPAPAYEPVPPVDMPAAIPLVTSTHAQGGAPSARQPDSLFGRYGRPERAQNIRSLLQRLSDAVEGGDV